MNQLAHWFVFFILNLSVSNGFSPKGFADIHRSRPLGSVQLQNKVFVYRHYQDGVMFSRKNVLVKAFANTAMRPNKQQAHSRRNTETNHTMNSATATRTVAAVKTETKPVAEDTEIILTLFNERYNLTGWEDHHPGGIAALRRFHNRNATMAYEKIGHSREAHALLERFRIVDEDSSASTSVSTAAMPPYVLPTSSWRSSTLSKLITHEDPFHVHKILGIFCLLHFIYRYTLVLSGLDVTAGFGSMGRATVAGTSARRVATTAAFLLPHAMLSSTSLLFHTVPLERVRGKPMIWKEYRWHNMVFCFRSLVACFLATLMIKLKSISSATAAAAAGTGIIGVAPTMVRVFPNYHMTLRQARVAIVAASCLTCLATNVLADVATAKLRTNATETTITNVPFWPGCSPAMHNGLRAYYGYSQFAATLTCLMVCQYPSWSFLIVFPIQLASLLMTLVRKSIISGRQSHIGYTVALILPLMVFVQNALVDPSIAVAKDLMAVLLGAGILYGLRRQYRINKYALWIPTAMGRIAMAALWQQ